MKNPNSLNGNIPSAVMKGSFQQHISTPQLSKNCRCFLLHTIRSLISLSLLFYDSILTSQNREALSPVEPLFFIRAESLGSLHLHLNASPENGWKIFWIHDSESGFQLCSKREFRQVSPDPDQYKKPLLWRSIQSTRCPRGYQCPKCLLLFPGFL